MGERELDCPACGAALYFAPSGNEQYCERCGHRRPVEALQPELPVLTGRLFPRFSLPEMRAQLGVTNTRELLHRGIGAAKAGDREEAAFYLGWLLQTEAGQADHAEGWLWLSQLQADPAEKRHCLENVLAIDPAHPVARRRLAILNGRLSEADLVDPDQLPAVAKEPPTVEAKQYRCPRCIARLTYVVALQRLRCDFCGYTEADRDGVTTTEATRPLPTDAQDFVTTLATARGHLHPRATRTFQCDSCSVAFMLAPEILSITCPYCDSVYVVEAAETEQIIPPQAILPFACHHEKAVAALQVWFRENRLRPSWLSPVIGSYVPVWSFTMAGEVTWRCLVSEGDQWVPRTGSYAVLDEDVQVPGSNQLPEVVVTGLDQFDLRGLVPYEPRYLADWPAERYQVSVADASVAARGRVVRGLQREAHRLVATADFRNFILGSRSLVVDSYRLLLLPVWIAHFSVAGRRYDVVVNGQTGQVTGERPKGVVGKVIAWLKGE